jgi:hypothetical protein
MLGRLFASGPEMRVFSRSSAVTPGGQPALRFTWKNDGNPRCGILPGWRKKSSVPDCAGVHRDSTAIEPGVLNLLHSNTSGCIWTSRLVPAWSTLWPGGPKEDCWPIAARSRGPGRPLISCSVTNDLSISSILGQFFLLFQSDQNDVKNLDERLFFPISLGLLLLLSGVSSGQVRGVS